MDDPTALWKSHLSASRNERNELPFVEAVVPGGLFARLIYSGGTTKVVSNWPIFRDRLDFTVGLVLSMYPVGVNSLLIGSKIRELFFFKDWRSRMGVAVATLCGPFLLGCFGHYFITVDPLSVGKDDICHPCLYAKQLAANSVIGILMPYVFFTGYMGGHFMVLQGIEYKYKPKNLPASLKFLVKQTFPVWRTAGLCFLSTVVANALGHYVEYKTLTRMSATLEVDPELAAEVEDAFLNKKQTFFDKQKFDRARSSSFVGWFRA